MDALLLLCIMMLLVSLNEFSHLSNFSKKTSEEKELSIKSFFRDIGRNMAFAGIFGFIACFNPGNEFPITSKEFWVFVITTGLLVYIGLYKYKQR